MAHLPIIEMIRNAAGNLSLFDCLTAENVPWRDKQNEPAHCALQTRQFSHWLLFWESGHQQTRKAGKNSAADLISSDDNKFISATRQNSRMMIQTPILPRPSPRMLHRVEPAIYVGKGGGSGGGGGGVYEDAASAAAVSLLNFSKATSQSAAPTNPESPRSVCRYCRSWHLLTNCTYIPLGPTVSSA